jgi:hypothetical protein
MIRDAPSEILAGACAESRFFKSDGLLSSSEAIRKFFVRMFEEFERLGVSFEMLRQEVDEDTAYIVWRAEAVDNILELGSDAASMWSANRAMIK